MAHRNEKGLRLCARLATAGDRALYALVESRNDPATWDEVAYTLSRSAARLGLRLAEIADPEDWERAMALRRRAWAKDRKWSIRWYRRDAASANGQFLAKLKQDLEDMETP